MPRKAVKVDKGSGAGQAAELGPVPAAVKVQLAAASPPDKGSKSPQSQLQSTEEVKVDKGSKSPERQ